jgi:hypothetical protein
VSEQGSREILASDDLPILGFSAQSCAIGNVNAPGLR